MLAVMKATAEAESLEVRDVLTPRPGAGEVLVKLGAAGICYSDVMIL